LNDMEIGEIESGRPSWAWNDTRQLKRHGTGEVELWGFSDRKHWEMELRRASWAWEWTLGYLCI
jgi:hypothetical protein